jgi:iron complex transport system substrate-binding protein
MIRHRALAALAAALVIPATSLGLVACGDGDEEASAAATTAATRTITHFAGTTEVPATPERIVTLQDQNALLPLLELGVRPVASAGLVAEDGTRSFRRTEGFDTSGIEHIGAYGEPNLERIAAQEPDLIIADEFSAEGVYDQLSAIAPTVIVQVFGRPLSEALLDFAETVGREDRARELQAEYDARIAALRDRLGDDRERTTVSLLAAGDPGSFGQSDSGGQAQYTVMRDLDLPRPPLQRPGAVDDFAEFSLERLPDHDADVVIVTDFSGERQSPGTSALVGSRLFRNLAAARAGQTHVIDGTRSVGSAWARMGVFIDELERILLDPDLDHDVVRDDG